MPPILALAIWATLLLALLRWDPAKEPQVSRALWVPTAWLFLLGSRQPSQWLGLSHVTDAAQALAQGNPVDRAIYLCLIAASVAILWSRPVDWRGLLTRNAALTAFLVFAFLSILWSDFPFVTFKKLFRDMGVYLTLAVVLTDPRPVQAVLTVIRRLCYFLIPLSIVLIKYYPHLAKTYTQWGGAAEYGGVTTSKNLLCLLCAVSVIFFFWDTLVRWSARREGQNKRAILVNVAFIAMTAWILHLAHSATANVCMALACPIIAIAHSSFGRRHTGFVKALAPAAFLGYVIAAVGFGMSGQLAEAVGKSKNLSDRTHIWHILLSAQINPIVGTGYQSFWLGSRIHWFDLYALGDNVHEAHDGYLGVYLDLGLIGLALICWFLIATYRTMCRRVTPFTAFGSLSLALWTVLVFFNVTEAAFEMGFIWFLFVIVALIPPQPLEDQAHSPPLAGVDETERRYQDYFEAAGGWR